MPKRAEPPRRARQCLSRWYDDQLLADTLVLRGSIFAWLFGRFGQRAVTINKTVHLAHRAPDLATDSGIALLGHECYHVLQQREMGWWNFLARYIWRWRPYHVKSGWRHPLEQPAYQREREVRAAIGPV